MKVITLTAAQIAALAPLQAAAANAATAHQNAINAVKVELASIATAAGVTTKKHPRLSLSDDGNSLIVQ